MTDLLNKFMLSCIKLRLASALDVSTISKDLLITQREIACMPWKQESCSCECAALPSGVEDRGREIWTCIYSLKFYHISKTNLNSLRAVI